MKRLALWAVLLSLLAVPALAVEPRERLADPALEARARDIGSVLRCLVCQNESIDESGADLAHDIRMLVRQKLAAGESNAQVIQSVVDRYGDFVLLKPPVQPATYALWFTPPLLVAVGGLGFLVWMRRRPAEQLVALPLTNEERSRLDRLLRESEE